MLHRVLRCEFGRFRGYYRRARNRKIRGNCRSRSRGDRGAALAIPVLVRLVGTLARRHFGGEGQLQILLSASYLRSHQHSAYDCRLDSPALNGRLVQVRWVAPILRDARATEMRVRTTLTFQLLDPFR
jgi:hypothetical protein